MNKIDDEFQYDDDDLDVIVVNHSHTKNYNNLPKKFLNPVLNFEESNDEKEFRTNDHISPDTLYSPKDKVSNLT